MWSGPRNISTALMRSFGSRSDTAVCDEPLYAHYLEATGADHPGRAEVLAAHERDWRAVARFLTGPAPDGKAVFYQKHMAHHLLPEIERDWLWRLEHAFLIREPREMLRSLARVTPRPTLADTGLSQQVELYRVVAERSGAPPLVIDARDVLEDPPAVLGALCAALGLEFQPAMLAWPGGLRPTDGVWAKHWYAEVARSTGFQRPGPPSGAGEELAGELARVAEQCREPYRFLHERRITG